MNPAIYQRLHPQSYLSRFLEKGYRTDGRKSDDWRPVGLNVGSITTAEGSALVRLGETTVVCGVKAEIAEPELDRPLDGWIVPNVDLPSLCSPKYKPGPPSDDSQILSERLFEVLLTVLDTKSLSIEPGKFAWVLYVDATCINYDGNMFDATLLAMLAALKNTRLHKASYFEDQQKVLCSREETHPLHIKSFPLAFTYGTFEAHLLADPTAFEEPLVSSSISVIVDENSNVTRVSQEGFSASAQSHETVTSGNVTESLLRRCIEAAKRRRKDILEEHKM